MIVQAETQSAFGTRFAYPLAKRRDLSALAQDKIMSQKFRKNQHVTWKYGSGTASGQIVDSFKEKVTKTIKGTEVTRNATEEEPAYLVKQEDGDEVLKSESELSKA